MSEPIHISDADFQQKVLDSNVPVVVDFWAPWCGPCKVIAPALEQIAHEQGEKVVIAKINTDENPDWAARFGVMGLPTLLFLKGGKEVARHTGAAPALILKKKVESFLAS